MKYKSFITLFLLCASCFSLDVNAQSVDCKQTHKVEKKETIYGISHKYGLTEQELINANPSLQKKGLKKGDMLCIPYSAAEKEQFARAEKEKQEAIEREKQKKRTIKVGVVLPFALGSSERTVEADRMIDFYEGMLMVVDSMKQEGVNLDVVTIDEGSSNASQIKKALESEALKNVDIIIGPGLNSDVDQLASFAQMNQIPLVVPFSNKKNIAGGRRYVLQTNLHQSEHYGKVFSKFIAQHKNDNIIFVGMNDKNDNTSYIVDFKKALDNAGISHKRVSYTEFNSQVEGLMSKGKMNIFIPSSPSVYSFDMLTVSMGELNLADNYDVCLFGYPEWQNFAMKNHSKMCKYQAIFFTGHYHNNLSTRTKTFCQNFVNSFNHEQVQGYPQFGEMGHDVAAFTLTCLQKYGDKFLQNVESHKYRSLHMPFNFTSMDSQSGHVNTAFYFLRYQKDGNIILNEY